MKYEFRICSIGDSKGDLRNLEELNELGKDGWKPSNCPPLVVWSSGRKEILVERVLN